MSSRTLPPVLLAFAAALGTACGNGNDDHVFSTGTGADGSASTEASGTQSGTQSGDGDGDGDDAPRFDTPDGDPTADDGGGDGCDKIDFLFVIDNSGSMAPHQQKLIANFPAFIDTIAAEVQGQDYHVMAIDTDECPTMAGGCVPSSCEEILGAGQVRNCPVPDDTRYLTSAMSIAEIKDGFTCAANVGDFGSATELPMSAMLEVVGPQNEAQGCNPGFLRDDAVLVMTIITDDHTGWFGEDNAKNVGSPQEWYDGLIAAKGKPENVVILGLFALLEDQSCIGFGPNESVRFIEFVEMFGDHGMIASVCEQDYNAFFQEAVGLIDTTCDEFMPEG
jgi:hypothetical protein